MGVLQPWGRSSHPALCPGARRGAVGAALERVEGQAGLCHLRWLCADTMLLRYATSPCPRGKIHPAQICGIVHEGITNTEGTVLPRGCLLKPSCLLQPPPQLHSIPESAPIVLTQLQQPGMLLHNPTWHTERGRLAQIEPSTGHMFPANPEHSSASLVGQPEYLVFLAVWLSWCSCALQSAFFWLLLNANLKLETCLRSLKWDLEQSLNSVLR